MLSHLTVTEDGKQIVLDFPTLAEALGMWKPWADARRRGEAAEVLHRAMAAAGVVLQLRVQGQPVASLGGSEMTGLMLRLLQAAPSS